MRPGRALAAATALALAAAAPVSAAPAVPAGGIAPMVVTPEKQAAAEFAFVLALARSAVSGQCAQLPEPVHGHALSALASWRARNQPLVEPLLSWSNYVAGIDASDAAQQKQNLTTMIGGYKAKAAALAHIELGTATPDAAACETALARFEDPTRDLGRSMHAPHLAAIRDFIRQLSTQGPATR
jgi:hypothetical protein